MYFRRLIDCLLFCVPLNFLYLYGEVIIAGKGLQNLDLNSALTAFEQEGDLYRATPAVTRGLSFSVSSKGPLH
jgi:hypothetical protein